MTVTAELRYAEPKEIAAEARQVLKAAFPGVRFSVRSADNTVAVTYSHAGLAEDTVWETVRHLRAFNRADQWGAQTKNPIRLASGETVKGLHNLTARNSHRGN